MFYLSNYQSPIGNLTLLTDETAILGLWLQNQAYFGAGYDLNEALPQETPISKQVKSWLNSYFGGEVPSLASLPLAPNVTEFRKKVLAVLVTIPYGKTITYQEIVAQLSLNSGKKVGSARAVGGAVAHNPISIIIPCHRVIGSNGSLTGYAGGIEAKKSLLRLEGIRYE